MQEYLARYCLLVVALFVVSAAGCSESGQDSKSNAETGRAGSNPGMPDLSSNLSTISKQVSERTDQIFAAIEAGESKQIFESMAAPRFRESATLEQFQSLCERIQSRLGTVESKESTQFMLSNPEDHPLSNPEDHPIVTAEYEVKFAKGKRPVIVVFEQTDEQWLLLRLKVNAPELLDDSALFRESVELLVQNSEPFQPGTMVDVVDESTDPSAVLAENVKVLNVRWKVSSPLEAPKFPAGGFVTVALTKEQVHKVRGIDALSLRINDKKK